MTRPLSDTEVGAAGVRPDRRYWSAMGAAFRGKQRFGWFLLGASVTNLGRWFLTLAASVLVYDLSGSTLMVGLVSVSQYAPTILLAPWAGIVADSFDRRRVVATAQLGVGVLTAVLAVLVLTDVATSAAVLAVMFGCGVCQAFQAPASLALAPLLVAAPQRDIALSLNSMQFNLARAVGPMLGAIVITQTGMGVGLTVNAVMFLAVIIALACARPRKQILPSGRTTLRDVLVATRRSPYAIPLLLTGAVISGGSDIATTLTPAVSDRFTGSSDATGYLVSGFGVGAALTALLVYPVIRRFRRQMVGAMVAQGLGVVIFSLAPNLGVAIAGLALSGGGFVAASTRGVTLLQDAVPAEMAGRMMSLWTLAFLGVRPLFSLTTGLVADLAGTRVAGLTIAAILLLAAGALHLNTAIRRRRAVANGGS